MKKLNLFLCLLVSTVSLSAVSLQSEAATEKGGIEVTATQETQKSEAIVQRNEILTHDTNNLVGTKLEERQATTQDAKSTSVSVMPYTNQTYVFKQAGLLHVYTNSKAASVYLANSSTGKIIDQGYASSTAGYHVTFAVSKGTYKLGITPTAYYYSGVRYQGIKKEVPTFTPSKNMTVTRNDNFYSKTSYLIKFRAKRTGVLIAKPISGSTGFSLLSSKKKALSANATYYTSSNAAFGVKKGTTYYLKVSGYGQLKYSLKFQSINEKSGSKKSKAVRLSKKNKWSQGTLLAGSKTADWYKIKLSKKNRLSLVIKPQTSDGLYISVYGPDGKQYGKNHKITSYYNGVDYPMYLYTYSGFSKNYKVKSGTYYVKISRANKKSSGSYSIKWNNKKY